jgi:hypothetical protein
VRIPGDDESPEWQAALPEHARGTRHRARRCPIFLRPRESRLWHRAVREQQRIGAMSEQAADEVVTSVINHLGQLAEKAPWFGAPGQLREAAIDETLRHAMLGDAVPSEAAQLAWARYCSAGPGVGRQSDPATMRAEFKSLLALEASWLAAWEVRTGHVPRDGGIVTRRPAMHPVSS